MKIWLDAQLSPMTAKWINEQYLNLEATPLRELNLLRASDHEIFQKAKESNAILITKDRDFLKLLNLYGPPPQIIWLRIGNSSNSFLQEVLSSTLLKAINILKAGDPWVEIRFKPKGETQKAKWIR